MSEAGELRQEPLPIPAQIAASAVLIAGVLTLMHDLPHLVPLPKEWVAVQQLVLHLVFAVVKIALARGLWLHRRGAWRWTVGLFAFALLGYPLWAVYVQHIAPGHWTWTDWFGWQAITSEAWVYGPLVLLLLPASRRAFARPG